MEYCQQEDDRLARPLSSVRRRRIVDSVEQAEQADALVRCVSSGYMSDGCSCQATIPLAAVTAAWEHQPGASGTRRGGFFHLAWHDEVWLAYGLADGRIRGVYCPTHAAERDERSFTGETLPALRSSELQTIV